MTSPPATYPLATPALAGSPRPVDERGPVDRDTFHREIVPAFRPVVLRGQVADWAAVAAARQGRDRLVAYLSAFPVGKPADVMIGAPAIDGRFFYNEDLSGFNFRREKATLHRLLAELVNFADDPAPFALYANAAASTEHLPGWDAANPLPLAGTDAQARLWIGNRTQIATHYDVSMNIACVVAGRRRFTLFPPEQIANLYVGPLDHTPAGPPVSMVDPDAPDLDRYPRFAEAWAHAQVAELEPGDALFIPPIWWHHVRAFDAINVLVNYWWAYDSAATPFLALVHALMSVRDLPPPLKAAWKSWFDHYIFGGEAAHVADHLPEAARTVLGPDSPERRERIKGFLIRALAQG